MWFLDSVHELAAASPRRRLPRIATAYLVSPPSGGRAVVRLWDGEEASVPAQPGVYSGITTVSVQVDEHGRPVLVFGPTTAAPVAEPEEPSPEAPPDSPEAPKSATKSTRVYAADSGTYSTKFGSWGSWGGSWDGYPYSAGQGSIFSSGTLLGAAFYGNNIKSLGATAITKATVKIAGARQGYGWTPVLRLVTNGTKPSGAPSYASADTVTGPALDYDEIGYVELPAAMREQLRTGAAKGLALVGSTYGVTLGKGTSGLSVALTYEVTT